MRSPQFLILNARRQKVNDVLPSGIHFPSGAVTQ